MNPLEFKHACMYVCIYLFIYKQYLIRRAQFSKSWFEWRLEQYNTLYNTPHYTTIIRIFSKLIVFLRGVFTDQCNKPLGVEDGRIKDNQLSASSAWDDNTLRYGAARGRLHFKIWPQGWNAKKNDPYPWFQIDFGSTMTVTGVATQGFGASQTDEWVKSYSLATSFEGKEWEAYIVDNKEKVN